MDNSKNGDAVMKIKCSGHVSVEDYIELNSKYDKLQDAVLAVRGHEWRRATWIHDAGDGYSEFIDDGKRLRVELDNLVGFPDAP